MVPPFVSTIDELEEILSRPSPQDIEAARRLDGDVLIIGAGGKMGPTLARRLLRSLSPSAATRVYAASRFTDQSCRQKLETWGARTIGVDLLDARGLADLPNCRNLIYMVGSKFGTRGHEDRAWAINTYLAGRVAELFAKSRIVAFSTGNVYPLVPVDSGGSRETDGPGPVGEYAQSCLGRERLLRHFSEVNKTPMALLRLNYAIEGRYGVLLDIAQRIHAGEPVPLAMGFFNAIWQGDANSLAIRAFDHCQTPPLLLNVTGPETLSVRQVGLRLGDRMGRPVAFDGVEAKTALLSDATRSVELFGAPTATAGEMIDWVAHWVKSGGPTLGKSTRFEVRDGDF